MCRWLAYSGKPVLLYEVLYGGQHSLVTQSLHSTEGAEATNGDGFGVGWYGIGNEPAQYRSVEPAWHDRNMKDLSKHIISGLIFSHVRAASPSVSIVQQTNCHPFRHGQWLWMHNGVIRGFKEIKRDLVMFIDPKYFAEIQGSTDSEVFFYLALTYGLEQDPPTAVAKAVGHIIKLAASKVQFPIQMTVCTTDGTRMWAFRYSSEGKSRSLYYSSDIDAIKSVYGATSDRISLFDNTSRMIVSEPLADLPGVWNKIPESTSVFVAEGGAISFTPFEPIQGA